MFDYIESFTNDMHHNYESPMIFTRGLTHVSHCYKKYREKDVCNTDNIG